MSGAASVGGPAALLLRDEAQRIERLSAAVISTLRGWLDAILCPSGTDAVLTAARLIAAEHGGAPMMAILPSASETGTGVPLAAAGRAFDGPLLGRATPTPADIGGLEVALRGPTARRCRRSRSMQRMRPQCPRRRAGRGLPDPRHQDRVDRPCRPPRRCRCDCRRLPGADRSGAREGVSAAGWPVVVTGSKFFGGPAFSGAVLFPLAPGARSGPDFQTRRRHSASLDRRRSRRWSGFAPVSRVDAAGVSGTTGRGRSERNRSAIRPSCPSPALPITARIGPMGRAS